MAKVSITEIVWSMALPLLKRPGANWLMWNMSRKAVTGFCALLSTRTGRHHEDCERVSQPLNRILDERDPISHPFYLEVSSPGLERRLKRPGDYERALGKLVEIRLFKAVDGTKRYEGYLESFDGKELSIRLDSGEIKTFPLDQVAKAKTLFKY